MKHLLSLTFFSILALSLSAQTYIEEPCHNSSNAIYITKYMASDNGQIRSFTFKYDPEKRVSLWVAYPLNTRLIGAGSRGEGWQPEEEVPEEDQAILYKGFRYGSGYDRGHQIPSADRLSPEANRQTFTFTNATPQLHDFNGGIWAELEKVVRTWAKRSDTLYVVTGCIPGEKTIPDNVGTPVNIPSAYYKAVLRRNTDKRGNVYWAACAVLLPHNVIIVGNWQQNLAFFKENSLSLNELEKKTGEKFFPKLKEIIGSKLYTEINKAHPSEVTWWWK